MRAKEEVKEEGEGDTERELPAPAPTYSLIGCYGQSWIAFQKQITAF